MKGAYRTIFVVVFFNFYVDKVIGTETDEEYQPRYEYIQIFRSIPTLFEYLLNALEKRPEILESNEVTMFERSLNFNAECSESDKKTDKRDVDCDHTKMNLNDIEKRDISKAKDDLKMTVAYEYGNSNTIMKGLDDKASNGAISKRMVNDLNDEDFQKDILNKNLVPKKRSALAKLADDKDNVFHNYGKVFFGFEHLFGLDLNPEDIEELILEAEKLLEEHNDKKDKK